MGQIARCLPYSVGIALARSNDGRNYGEDNGMIIMVVNAYIDILWNSSKHIRIPLLFK